MAAVKQGPMVARCRSCPELALCIETEMHIDRAQNKVRGEFSAPSGMVFSLVAAKDNNIIFEHDTEGMNIAAKINRYNAKIAPREKK